MVNHPQLQPASAAAPLVPTAAEKSDYMATLTSLPLGHFLAEGGKMDQFHRGGRKHGKGSEKSLGLGNDESPPWLKVPPARSVSMTIIAGQIRLSSLLTISPTLNTYGASQFSLNQLAEYASWTTVFDQYRILVVECVLEFPMNESTSITSDPGRWVSVIDTDDATVPTSLDVLTSYSTAVSSSATQSHFHRWAPGVAVDLYTGAFGGFGTAVSPWIDCASANVVHYGLKYGCSPGAGAGVLGMTYKFHVEFRCTR